MSHPKYQRANQGALEAVDVRTPEGEIVEEETTKDQLLTDSRTDADGREPALFRERIRQQALRAAL
jgi:hypothetical protein